jgi:hypothetical protein
MKWMAAMLGAGVLFVILAGACCSPAAFAGDDHARAGASAGRFAASAIPADDESAMDENEDAGDDEADPDEWDYGFEREHTEPTLVEAQAIEADVA